MYFFFNYTEPNDDYTYVHTLSLHDDLPIFEHTMIKSLQANPNILRFHVHYRFERAKNKPPKMSSRIDIPARNYPGRLKNRTARIRRFERFAAYITWRSS